MAETYCGKTCAECSFKEQLNCSGCKTGPGRQYASDCKLAQCCRDKGHEECAGCGHQLHCNALLGKDRAPEYRLKSIENQKMLEAAVAARAPLLGKWLRVLFWLIFPSGLAAFMSNQNISGSVPVIYWVGMILGTACILVKGLIFLRLAVEENRYRTAGICTLIGAAISLLLALIAGNRQISVWTLLISVPTLVLGFVGTYYEYTAHSAVLTGVDNALSEKWRTLWKWYVGIQCGMVVMALAMSFAPILGLVIALPGSVVAIVVAILSMVYLYRTASVFRNYQTE